MREHRGIACGDWGSVLAPQLLAAGIYYVAFSDQEKSHYGPLNEASSLVCIDKTAGIRKVRRGEALPAFHPTERNHVVRLSSPAKEIIQGWS